MPKAMKTLRITVLSIHQQYDTRIANHLRTMLNEGYDVTYVNWSNADRLSAEWTSPSFRLVWHNASPAFGLNVIRYAFMLLWFTGKAFSNRGDVFHIHDLVLLPIAPALRLLTQSRVVFDVHEHYKRYGGLMGLFARFCYTVFLPAVDAFIAVTPSTLPETRKPHFIVPNYQRRLDYAWIDNNGGKDGHFRVVYFGNMSTETREVGLMLELAERCLSEIVDIEFRFGGPLGGPDREPIRERLEELAERFPHRFRWFGVMPRETVIRETAQADIGLLLLKAGGANTTGSQPNKIFEYLTVGAVTLATDGFVIADEMRQAGAVILFSPGIEVGPVVAALCELSADRERLAVMKAASSKLGRKYSWEAVEGRYVELYRQLTK